MGKQLWELTWTIGCLEFEFLRTEWHVFESREEARAYGLRIQDELNGGVSPVERANDGYFFEFEMAEPVGQIDGYRILLQQAPQPGKTKDATLQPPPPESLSLDEALLFCAHRIVSQGTFCTFERLVHECFTVFPSKFSLRGYPHWPDSARVNKCWLRCRSDKGWLAGSVQEGFTLTPKGLAALERLQARLPGNRAVDQPKRRKPGTPRARSPEEAVINRIRAAPAFKRFVAERARFRISESDFRKLLLCTFETPPRSLKERLHYYLQAAVAMGDQECQAFLAACRSQFSNLLTRPWRRR